MLDLITFGHTTTDVFLKISDAEVLCNINHGNCRLCFDYADKVPVDSFNREVGGNAPNAACGSARLGLSVSIITSIGKDANGDFVLKRLKEEGVTLLKDVSRDNYSTDYSTIINFKGERTILAYHEKRKYTFPQNLEPAHFGYLSSMGEDFAGFNRSFLEWAKRSGAKIAFNPGMYELKAGKESIRDILQGSFVLILNREEAENLLFSGSIRFGSSVKELLSGLHKLGPRNVVITDGRDGAYYYNGVEYLKIGIFPGRRVEMTGAGDSFSSGVLSALLLGENFKSALRWGAANSASVIQHVGSIAGLLSRSRMNEILRRSEGMVARSF